MYYYFSLWGWHFQNPAQIPPAETDFASYGGQNRFLRDLASGFGCGILGHRKSHFLVILHKSRIKIPLKALEIIQAEGDFDGQTIR
jgi:hypothetical protein